MRILIVAHQDARGALAAIRELGHHGVDVGIGTPEPGGMLARSRWVSRSHHVPLPRGDDREFLASLQTLAPVGYDLVFGGGDDLVAALARHRDELPMRVAHPPFESIARSLDLLALPQLAADAGLTVPPTTSATARSIADWRGPAVVKARSHWIEGRLVDHRIPAAVISGLAEVRERVAWVRAAGGEPILQEPVEGPLIALASLSTDEGVVRRQQQRAAGVWPFPAGVSTRAVTEPIDEELWTCFDRLLALLSWRGVMEAQFIEPVGRAPVLIDLNGRFYGSMALARAAGSELAWGWVQSLSGTAVQERDAQVGVRYQWFEGDLRRALVERRGGLARDVLGTFAWAATSTDSVFDLRDPLPGFARPFEALRSLVPRRGTATV